MSARTTIVSLLALCGAAAPASAFQVPPSARGDDAAPTPAEREWQDIQDELIPKLVQFRALPEAEKRKETFRAELSRIGEFVRKYQAVDPLDLLWTADGDDTGPQRGEGDGVLTHVSLEGENADRGLHKPQIVCRWARPRVA